MGIELDKAFNANKDKTREGWEGACVACDHDITKNHRRKEPESTKDDSQESCKRCNWV